MYGLSIAVDMVYMYGLSIAVDMVYMYGCSTASIGNILL